MRLLVTPALVGRAFGSVLSEGQIASSMMSMHEAPMYVLILVVRVESLDDEPLDESNSPKVDQAEDHPGHDGKVGEVEAE